MKNQTSFAVRIVEASNKPSIAHTKNYQIPQKSIAIKVMEKTLHFCLGSGTGLIAGSIIYLLLVVLGVNLGGIESGIIIGLPSIVGLVTTFATY